MARKKGAKTKAEILNHACRMFSQKGYHNTTVQEICQAAEVNIASINYHFGGKDKLYLKAWEKIEETLVEFEADIDSITEPELKLKHIISVRVEQALADEAGHWHVLLIHKEMTQPSPLHESILEKFMKNRMKHFHNVIREIIEADVEEEDISLLVLCIHSPLIHIIEIKEKSKKRKFRPVPIDQPQKIAETIYLFALAGLNDYKSRHQPRSQQ